MEFAVWSVLVGLLLVLMALGGSVLRRLPLSMAMLYLAVGVGVSPLGLSLVNAGPLAISVLLERLAEVAVLVSLFTAGLKLSPGLADHRWRLPLRLAATSMVVTVLAVAALAHWALGLPWGAAVLLGAVLAPTDPVLASDVQIHQPGDRDRLRFALTGEGGLNDGTAFPFVMLGLGLLGLHDLGDGGWRWVAVDVVWAVGAGIGIGALLGVLVGRLVLYLRREHREAVGLDDFLALGLIGLSYGIALLLHAYGFLAVFAAGVALRHLEQSESREPSRSVKAVAMAQVDPDRSVAESIAVDPAHAPAWMAQAVLGFNEQVERIGEVTVVIAIGALLWAVQWHLVPWWFAPVLLVAIRPLAVMIGLAGATAAPVQRRLIAWFGIRGIGSMYYLMYAVNHGLEPALAQQLIALTLSVVVLSILVHGISVTPLMALYERKVARARRALVSYGPGGSGPTGGDEGASTVGHPPASGMRSDHRRNDMNPDKEQRPGAREPKARAYDRDDSSKTTPAADLQGDDAISPGLSEDLGADGTPAAAPSTPASRASKQQSKTDAGR